MNKPDDTVPASPPPEGGNRLQPGWNDMAEDVLGLSLRGFLTVRDAFLAPSRVFTAARISDWNDRYTPSLRLVTSLIALMLLLRIFWAGENSGMYQAVVAQMDRIVELYPELDDPAALAESYFNSWALVFPFVYLPVHLIASLFVRVWGKGTSTVARIRLYFAAIVPGLVISTAALLILPLMAFDRIGAFTLISFFFSFSVYGLTVFFGLRPVHPSRMARLWRAVVMALTVAFADTIASLGANLLGGVVIGYSL